MPRTLEELKKALEGKSDIISDFESLINDEKTKGVETHKKANREAQNLRKFKTAMESLGLSDPDNLDVFTADVIKKMNKKEDGASTLTVKALKQDFESKLGKLTSMLENERNDAKFSKLTAKLTNEFGDKVVGAKYFIQSLISDKKVNLVDGEVVFELDGETLPFKDGSAKILDMNKDILKTSITKGSSTNPSHNEPDGDVERIMNSGDATLISQNLDKIKSWLNN